MVLLKGGNEGSSGGECDGQRGRVEEGVAERMQSQHQFNLPQDGYFFIYKQNVIEDDRSFRWHHVAQSDTIEIFNGSITGGS